jgi:hypothetical protein
MKASPTFREEEDATAMAGWMYADLLIGLMVIFLATITFIPTIGGMVGNATTGKPYFYTYSRTIEDKPLTVLIEGRKIPDLKQIISDFKVANQIASDARVAYVQIIGSYRENLETKETAITRALELSQQLQEMYGDIFKSNSTTFNTTTSIPTNQTVIRILFSEIVSVGEG